MRILWWWPSARRFLRAHPLQVASRTPHLSGSGGEGGKERRTEYDQQQAAGAEGAGTVRYGAGGKRSSKWKGRRRAGGPGWVLTQWHWVQGRVGQGSHEKGQQWTRGGTSFQFWRRLSKDAAGLAATSGPFKASAAFYFYAKFWTHRQ